MLTHRGTNQILTHRGADQISTEFMCFTDWGWRGCDVARGIRRGITRRRTAEAYPIPSKSLGPVGFSHTNSLLYPDSSFNKFKTSFFTVGGRKS